MQVEHNNADLILCETCLFVWLVISFPSKATGSQSSQGNLKALRNLLAGLFVLLDYLHHLSWPSAVIFFFFFFPSSPIFIQHWGIKPEQCSSPFPDFFRFLIFNHSGFLIFSLLCKFLGLKHRLLSAWFWLWYRKCNQKQCWQSVHEWICCALIFKTITFFFLSSSSKNKQLFIKCFPDSYLLPSSAIKKRVGQAFIWKHGWHLLVRVIELLVLKISTLSSLEFRYCYDNCTFNLRIMLVSYSCVKFNVGVIGWKEGWKWVWCHIKQ